MSKEKEFPFETARRVTTREVEAARRAIEKKRERTRRLHPRAIAWAKKEAERRGVGYQTVINEALLRRARGDLMTEVEDRHAEADVPEAVRGALVLDRRRRDVIVEATVLVVRQDHHGALPLRSRAIARRIVETKTWPDSESPFGAFA